MNDIDKNKDIENSVLPHYCQNLIEKHFSLSRMGKEYDSGKAKYHAALEVEGIIKALEENNKLYFGSVEQINFYKQALLKLKS